MDSFLDTNVIVNYLDYRKGDESPSRSYLYIKNNNGKFVICYAVLRELNNLIHKFSDIQRAVLKKIEDGNYKFEQDKNLSKRDIPYLQKMYIGYRDWDYNKLKAEFSFQRDRFDIAVRNFIKNKADIKAVPFDEIKSELVNALHDIISNYPDCQILASALQYQEDKPVFLFVTADSEHFNPSAYEYIKDYSILKKCKFPELKNLSFD